jgi:3-oxoadipate enol-lactonase
MPFIEVNGASLRYDLAGAGSKTLVLVHEMGGTLESWDDVVPLLAVGRRVLRYDTRGAGLSEKIRGTANIDVMADDVAALLDALGVRGKVAIAGVAVGAAIALHFAARHPSRVAALIPMGPAVGVPDERKASIAAAADAMERDGMRAGMTAALANSYPVLMRGDRARFERVRNQRMGNDPASQAAIYRMLNTMDISAGFARIACPTLLLAGKHDGLRPPAVVEPLAKLIPGARFEPVESAHFMAAQTPELVAGIMNRFLAENGC